LILIEVLTTSPFTVYKDYGDSLDKLHIPVLDKEMHAFLSGFYTAACITDTGVQRLSYEDWLDREQIHANPNSHISDIADLQEEFLYDVAKRPGSLYLGPRRYIQEYHDELTQSMGTETTELLHRMFPPQISGKERKG